MKPMSFEENRVYIRPIRSAMIFHGKEVSSKYHEDSGMTSYDFESVGANPNEAIDAMVLKEDSGVPIWWSEGGINWCWYGASSEKEAVSLYLALTGKEPSYGTIITDRSDSYWQFRIHK